MKTKKALIVVDMQHDFIDGVLGTAEAVSIIPNVVSKIKENKENLLIATMDTHTKDYMNTQEGKHLPVVHCVKGTAGFALHKEIQKALGDEVILVEKPTFGSLNLISILNLQDELDEIELVGVCTDICVISNALLLKAAFPEIPIIVDSSCCAGTSIENHNNALAAMRMCQIEVI